MLVVSYVTLQQETSMAFSRQIRRNFEEVGRKNRWKSSGLPYISPVGIQVSTSIRL